MELEIVDIPINISEIAEASQAKIIKLGKKLRLSEKSIGIVKDLSAEILGSYDKVDLDQASLAVLREVMVDKIDHTVATIAYLENILATSGEVVNIDKDIVYGVGVYELVMVDFIDSIGELDSCRADYRIQWDLSDRLLESCFIQESYLPGNLPVNLVPLIFPLFNLASKVRELRDKYQSPIVEYAYLHLAEVSQEFTHAFALKNARSPIYESLLIVGEGQRHVGDFISYLTTLFVALKFPDLDPYAIDEVRKSFWWMGRLSLFLDDLGDIERDRIAMDHNSASALYSPIPLSESGGNIENYLNHIISESMDCFESAIEEVQDGKIKKLLKSMEMIHVALLSYYCLKASTDPNCKVQTQVLQNVIKKWTSS
jgi:hypothetical protein